MYVADPICSFIISILILLSVVPLIKSSASTLINKVPNKLEGKRTKIQSKIEKVDGVYVC